MSTTQSLLSLSTSRHEDTAANHDTHGDDENGEKEAVQTLVSHEKPLFPSLKPPAGAAAAAAAAGPLVLLSVLGHGAAGEMVPHTINRYLRDYQREGIRFIHGNYVRARGCILGDDMGLGKTVQVIQHPLLSCFFVQRFGLLLLFTLCSLLCLLVPLLLFILLGHWLSQRCASQDWYLGGHREQQASIPPDSVVFRAEETQQGR